MRKKQNFALFEECYKVDTEADKYKGTFQEYFYRGISLGFRSALATLGILHHYEAWKKENEAQS